MTSGIMFIVCGDKAEQSYTGALQSLKLSDNRYPIERIGRDYAAANKQASRQAKVTLFDAAPFENFLYLDADTRPREAVGVVFDILSDGWDIVITPSRSQDREAFWHVGEAERTKTLEEIGIIPVQLQCGVMAVAKNERTARLFSAWRDEWLRYSGEDQAAFIRALYQAPVKVWLLGYPWNGGAAIGHNFGATR